MGNIETLASWTVKPHDDHETVKVLYTARNDVFVKCHHIEWQGSVSEWQAALLAALAPTDHYPQLTDWVRAQPSGTFLLTVFSKKQTELQRFDLRDAPRKIVLSIRETELSTASFGSGVDYYAVWLSRHVSPECESKIPRGVKVYRER